MLFEPVPQNIMCLVDVNFRLLAGRRMISRVISINLVSFVQQFQTCIVTMAAASERTRSAVRAALILQFKCAGCGTEASKCAGVGGHWRSGAGGRPPGRQEGMMRSVIEVILREAVFGGKKLKFLTL